MDPTVTVREVASGVPEVTRRAAPGASGVAFDGADQIESLANWSAALRSADADILPEKGLLDARARDTFRNDAYVAGAAAVQRDNVVGALYRLEAQPDSRTLFGRLDETWEAEAAEEIETAFGYYAEGQANLADASRHGGLTAMVRLAITSALTQGEVLGAAEWSRDDALPYQSSLQLIDVDRLRTPWSLRDRRDIRGGVEVDSRGAPRAYHILAEHPGESPLLRRGYTLDQSFRRIPARKPWGRPMVLHIYERHRVGQSRGVSGMVAALTEMRMTKHFRKTELQRAVLAATYAATIESDMPDQVADMMGAAGDDERSASSRWRHEYLADMAAWTNGGKRLHLDGVQIPVTPPGSKLRIQQPGANGPVGDRFEASLLRHIAAALGVSYEQLSRDYSQTNYSSARAAAGETMRHFVGRKWLICDPVANFLYRLWFEEAVNYGRLDCLRRRRAPSFYDGFMADAYTRASWIGAGQGQIDPLKETQAAVLKLKAGLSTKQREIARIDGSDYRRTARQIARERALDGTLGNPSVYAEAGMSQDQENALSGTPQERETQ